MAWERTAWVTAAAVRSYFLSSAGRRVTASSVTFCPATCTWRTPSTSVRAGTAISSTSRPSSVIGVSDATATTCTGMSSVLIASTSVSTPSGRSGMLSTADRISLVTSSESRPKSHSTTRLATPLFDVARTVVTPSTPLIACSSGPATSLATISGDAPG